MIENKIIEDNYKSEHQKRLKMLSLQALMIMLAIILLPPLIYSANLITKSTTADEVIVAISIGVFSSVVYLWILDTTDILPFKSTWVSRSVYGAAIASILGTSAAVYQGYFVGEKYPFRGAWEISLDEEVFRASISYSKNSGTYWGYTNIKYKTDEEGIAQTFAIEIPDFNPDESIIIIRTVVRNNADPIFINEYRIPISVKRDGKLIEGSIEDLDSDFRMKRDN